MAMRFDLPRCPTCGELAMGTRELVPGVALLVFNEKGEAEYQGETRMDWNDQVTCHDQEGRVTLECPNGHQWRARLDEGRGAMRRAIDKLPSADG